MNILLGLEAKAVAPVVPPHGLRMRGLGAVLRAALLVFLLPVVLVICAVALLVPCCLRVPVCGTSLPRLR